MTAAPAVVRCTAVMAGVRLAHHPGYELRIARVEPVGDGTAAREAVEKMMLSEHADVIRESVCGDGR